MSLMVDSQSVNDAYKNFEASNVFFIRSNLREADALTKFKTNTILLNTIENERFDHLAAQ